MDSLNNSPLADLPASAGDMLSKLLHQWHHLHRSRATGGWWALSGFSFQTGLYLLRFFKGLQEGQTDPGRLAEIEILSDVVFPKGGQFILIQAKRNLDKAALIAALEEMYLLTNLCRKEAPALLPHLCFQIACRTKTTPRQPADVSLSEVIEEEGDLESWRMMLDQFERSNPIIVEPDSLDQLHVLLWNSGVLDTTALIEQCAGRMLRSFEEPSLTGVRNLGRDLAHIFRNAPRRDQWKPVGYLLTVEDVAPENDLAKYTGVLAGQTPKLEHLRRGFFRTRPIVDEQLSVLFEHWLQTVSDTQSEISGKVPVFWIAGRSGEGKSVLLLQLASRFVHSTTAQPILLLRSATDLVSLINAVPPSEANARFLYALVDDLYDVQDRDAWDEMIRNACAVCTPSVAIITCGPTEQLEQFQSRLSDQFDITAFLIPPLGQQEYEEFVEWFEKRTGTSRDRTLLTDENALLVQLIFELAQGMRIPEFAKRFRKRLSRAKLFEAARSILAVNSLYLDAPIGLVDTDVGRDALDRLCLQDQLHFRMTDVGVSPTQRGVRLAHAHLAWLIFKEWIEPPTTLAKGWAREVEQALGAIEHVGIYQWSSNLITAFVQTPYLSDRTSAGSEDLLYLRSEALQELYRKHIIRHGGSPSLSTLALWIKLQFHKPELKLAPDPLDAARAAFRDLSSASDLHGFVAFWAVKLAERRDVHTVNQVKGEIEKFLRQFPNNPGVGFALAQLYSQVRDRDWAIRVAREWLANAPENPEGYQLLLPLVAANSGDAAVREAALRWSDANPQHPQAYYVLGTLVANTRDVGVRIEILRWINVNPQHLQASWLWSTLITANQGDQEVRGEALCWLAANPRHPQVHQVLASLVAADPDDDVIREEALRWMHANSQHPQAPWLIATLVAANQDQGVREEALDWLASNSQHPQASHVLASLLAANAGDDRVREEALRWIDAQPSKAYNVLAPLVAANLGNDAVNEAALSWLDGNPQHPQAFYVLAPLVAANAGDSRVREEALGWLDANPQHPQEYHVLASLIASNPGDDGLREKALSWLQANSQHPRVHHVLAPLVAANAEDERVREEALHWLGANADHPQAFKVLQTMIARLPEKDRLLEMGEQYVKNAGASHPEEIAAVLLTAGKARPKYISLALDVAERSPKIRRALLYHLSRAAINNPENCSEYLNGAFDEQRKSVVCRSLAIGLHRRPDAIMPFLQETADRLSSRNLSLVFQYAISLDIPSDDLALAVGRWLMVNYQSTAYRRVLGALRRNPRFWERLRALMPIPNEVRRDHAG